MKARTTLRLLVAAVCAAALHGAHAFNLRPDGASVHAGVGGSGSGLAGVGLVWDWDFQRLRRKVELTAHTELLLNQWRAKSVGGGHESLTQVVLMPSLRVRLGGGASRWFIEAGIGASWMDQHLVTPSKTFGSRWNFHDMLGVGHSFAARHEHELNLRLVHVSNAGFSDPNPGHEFLVLRYVARF